MAQGVMLVYALVTVIGGVMGYKSAKSTASLIASLISGVLLLVGFTLSRTTPPVGCGVAAAVALALSVFFGMRLIKKGAKMPAIIMLPLSVVSLLVFVWGMTASSKPS
ncbi:MAG: TMEM14 family protein [Abditibacteriales bacterium]|nr:TMEM14 family protein [Abditibacteriales bacterium]